VKAVPGLLPWQALFLACACGAWAVHDPLTGALGAAVVAICNLIAGRSTPRVFYFPAAFLLGLGYAFARLPAVPDLPEWPEWIDQRPKGVLSGTVSSVEEKPGNRLEILLSEPVFRFDDGVKPPSDAAPAKSQAKKSPVGAKGTPADRSHTAQDIPLPGALVWTWQDPASRPTPGSRVVLGARPHATGGFDNPGTTDWGWRWRTRGVFLRTFTQGAKNVRVESEAPLTPVEAWRIRLREAVLAGAGGKALVDTPLADASAMEGGVRTDADAPPARSVGSRSRIEADPPSVRACAAGMVLGLVTGERFAIGPADLDRVRRASLSHLLAVSGMNLAAVLAMGWAAAWLAGLVWPGVYLRLPRPKLAALIGFPLALGYLWLGRFEPSLTRAGLMFACWGALLLLGRERVLLDGLFAALLMMFLWNPLCVFEVGLQLSAAAVAGLILLMPLARPLFVLFPKRSLWRWLGIIPLGWLLVTLAAQLAVLPIQFSVFGEASPHLYLNLLWVPVVEWAAQPLAYLGALTVLWLPVVGNALLGWSGWVCSLMLGSLRDMDACGLLTVYPVLRPWQPEVLGYVVLLGGLVWARSLGVRRRACWLCLCLALLAGPGLYRVWEQGRDHVRLTMLDVGQGQAVLIEARGGRRWLVDGGGTTSGTFDIGRAVVAPALTWGRLPRLDAVVMSHADRDHTGGLVYLLGSFRVGFLAGNGEIPKAGDFQAALVESGLTPQTWRAGQRVDLGDDLALEVHHPPQGYPKRGNDASLVLRLVWKGRGLAVLPGDAGQSVLDSLATGTSPDASLAADVLVAAHHGSASALSPGFYSRVGAKWALISCGRGNTFGFPAQQVLQALEQAGAQPLSTAYRGAISAEWVSPDAAPNITSMR